MEVQATHPEQHTSSLVEEAIVAELAETIELQAQKLKSLDEEVESLRGERNNLATELHMARAWIRELATELQRADPPQQPESPTLRERVYGHA
jgi:cob(I)alamin adenosyltransferase